MNAYIVAMTPCVGVTTGQAKDKLTLWVANSLDVTMAENSHHAAVHEATFTPEASKLIAVKEHAALGIEQYYFWSGVHRALYTVDDF